MKIYLYLSLLILLVSVSYSQWIFECALPYDTSFTPLPLRISVVDSSVAWVLCEDHSNPEPEYPFFLRRTVRGWKKITNTNLNPLVNARSIAARDSNTAWLGTSYPEEIYFTSNGGVNWILQCHISDTAYVEEIMFSKEYPEIGYAFADFAYGSTWHGARILKTTNSGLNWTQWTFEYANFSCAQNSMDVKENNFAWFGLNNVLSGQSKVIMTSNGGITWNIYEVNGGSTGPNSIQFSSNRQTGLYFAPGISTVIYRTTNSGANWSPAYTMNSYFYSSTMRWVNQTCNVYAHGPDIILRSVNNGLDWTYMTGINNVQLASMDAVKINSGTIYALAVDTDGKVYKLLDTVRPIGIENLGTAIPGNFKLYQNYPNPFNPYTIIKFDIAEEGNVTIEIFDVLGKKISEPARDEFRKAGSYRVLWDASELPGGVYFCRLRTGDFVSTKKMILVK